MGESNIEKLLRLAMGDDVPYYVPKVNIGKGLRITTSQCVAIQHGDSNVSLDFLNPLKEEPDENVRIFASKVLRSGDLTIYNQTALARTDKVIAIYGLIYARSRGILVIDNEEVVKKHVLRIASLTVNHGMIDPQKIVVLCPIDFHTGLPTLTCVNFRRMDAVGDILRHILQMMNDIYKKDFARELGVSWCEESPTHPDCLCISRDTQPDYDLEKKALVIQSENGTIDDLRFGCWYVPCVSGILPQEKIPGENDDGCGILNFSS